MAEGDFSAPKRVYFLARRALAEHLEAQKWTQSPPATSPYDCVNDMDLRS